jgi:hypothetical protein
MLGTEFAGHLPGPSKTVRGSPRNARDEKIKGAGSVTHACQNSDYKSIFVSHRGLQAVDEPVAAPAS